MLPVAFCNLWESVRVEQVTDLVVRLPSPSLYLLRTHVCLVLPSHGSPRCKPLFRAPALNRVAVQACFDSSVLQNVVRSSQAVLQGLERYLATKKSELIGLGFGSQGQREA